MSNKKLSEMPVVSSKDVAPMFTADEVIEKLAIAVNGMREIPGMSSQQRLDLELMYALAVAIRDKKI